MAGQPRNRVTGVSLAARVAPEWWRSWSVSAAALWLKEEDKDREYLERSLSLLTAVGEGTGEVFSQGVRKAQCYENKLNWPVGLCTARSWCKVLGLAGGVGTVTGRGGRFSNSDEGGA